jgi:hypothetical protein
MSKKLPKNFFNLNLRSAMVVIVPVVVGFIAGMTFSSYYSNNSVNPPSKLIPSTHICSCPDIPAGSNMAEYCKC